jgi:hypothetical protein
MRWAFRWAALACGVGIIGLIVFRLPAGIHGNVVLLFPLWAAAVLPGFLLTLWLAGGDGAPLILQIVVMCAGETVFFLLLAMTRQYLARRRIPRAGAPQP